MNNWVPTLTIISVCTATSEQSPENWVSLCFITETLNISLTLITAVLIIVLPNDNNNKMTMITVSLTTAVLIVFISNKLLTLFIMFEAAMVPTMVMITKIGGYPERATANIFIIVITIISSLPMLAFASSIVESSNDTLSSLNNNVSNKEEALWVMSIMVFIAKLPLFALHIWLPKAHVQAPTTGSIILAGVMLNLGGYGLVMMSSAMNILHAKVLTSVSVVSAVTITTLSVRQSDKNTMIAYSSVSHMIMMLANIVSLLPWSTKSSIISMLGHGIISPLIFLSAGNTVEEQKTKNNITANSSNYSSPQATIWILVMASNMSAPPTLNFIIEIEILVNISNKKSNSLITFAILAISVFCMLMATNFIQGNTKVNKVNKTSVISQAMMANILTVIVLTTVASNKVASQQSKACEAQV